MHIDEYFAEQVEKVKAGVADPATRPQFLVEWFKSEPARIIGQDPTRRGNFVREGGLTSEESREGWSAKVLHPNDEMFSRKTLRQAQDATKGP